MQTASVCMPVEIKIKCLQRAAIVTAVLFMESTLLNQLTAVTFMLHKHLVLFS